ncbi:hypothetical protein DFH11DRAFT_1592906 [Phellopilus nigrolimitatus]|nr:hypothetical protein DFH11DRAFT_1592906 [Phellopilus nigrolimitatus]
MRTCRICSHATRLLQSERVQRRTRSSRDDNADTTVCDMSAVPRPRPRPRPRAANSSTSNSGPGSSSAASLSKSPVDEDAMFIRNRSRGADGWRALTKAVNKSEGAKDRSSDLDLSDSDSPPTKKKSKKQPSKARELPEWTRSNTKTLITISSDGKSDDDDDNDDDDLFVGDTPRGKLVDRTPKGNRKRNRSRSCSLTPPPPVPVAQYQNARNLVTAAMGVSPPRRPPSPTILIDDDSDEIVELDPDLARIRAQMRASDTSQTSTGPSGTATISIRAKWLPHPLDETGKEELFTPVILRRNESFSQLFEEIADQAGILTDQLIVTYNNTRVFAASTPATLSIWSEAEFEACAANTYDYKRKQLAHRFSPLWRTYAKGPAPIDLPAPDSGADSDASQESRDDTFRLQLRSGAQTITVTFVRKIGKPASAAKKARIEVDGEKMSPESEISEADLEDGDLVDIVGV